MEAALKKTQIAHKYMCSIYTLKAFFKDEFKSGQSAYLITFDHIVFTKRNIFPYIREDCGFVCPKETPCGPHQFLNYVEMLWRSICWAVEEKKVYYRYFYFTNFRLTNDGKIAGWDAKPVEARDLSHLSYSKRMSYLNN